MLLQGKKNSSSAQLAEKLRLTSAITPDLISEVMINYCVRYHAIAASEETNRLHRLIAASAWIDSALMLLAIELPDLKLRRLAYDGGEWHCSLSKEPRLPDWLDDPVEATHEILPLAIISAFVAAQQASSVPATVRNSSIPQYRPLSYGRGQLVDCDNFR